MPPEADTITFDPEGHRYYSGLTELPSLSKIMRLGGLKSDLSMVPPAVLEKKRVLGNRVHKAIWLYLNDNLDWATLDDDVRQYVLAATRYVEDSGLDLEGALIERPFGSTRLGYACTPDLVLPGGHVIEWKTTYKIYPDVQIQLAGQALVVGDPGVRIVVQLKKDGTYSTKECLDEEDFEVFRSVLKVALWKIENGMDK